MWPASGGVKMQGNLRIGDRLIEPQANSIRAGRASVRIEPKVMQVLLHLARHATLESS